MSIRLRRTTIAAALENLAAEAEQQTGSYEGPRLLDDAPVRSVVDLSAYQEPVTPEIATVSGSIVSGGADFIVDVARPSAGVGTFVLNKAPEDEKFSFVRFSRVVVENSGASGGVRVSLILAARYSVSGALVQSPLYFRIFTGGDDAQLQYGYDAVDQNVPTSGTDVIVAPPGLVMPPDARLALVVENNTSGLVDVDVTSFAYTFDSTDILI